MGGAFLPSCDCGSAALICLSAHLLRALPVGLLSPPLLESNLHSDCIGAPIPTVGFILPSLHTPSQLETGRLLDVSHELRFHNAQLCSELQQLEAEVSLLRGREEEHSVWRGKLKRAYATWEEAQRREARRIVEREGEREQQHEQEVKEAEARAREFEEKVRW